MRNGIGIPESKFIPSINWDDYIFDYKVSRFLQDEESRKVPLNWYTKHSLQFSTASYDQIINYLTKPPKKIDNNFKHFLVINEAIVGDAGKNLMPRWWDYKIVKNYIKIIKERNPGVKLWIANHRLVNPLHDRVKKRETLIDIAHGLELDGVSIQVWLDWKMFYMPGHYLEKIIPKPILSKFFRNYQIRNIKIQEIENKIGLLPNDLINHITNLFSQGIISYIKEFAQEVKSNNLLFSVSEWAVFLENQERQYKVAKELLEVYKEVGAEFNCYWYLTDNLPRPQPGKTGTPGLFDKDLNPKKISTLFLK